MSKVNLIAITLLDLLLVGAGYCWLAHDVAVAGWVFQVAVWLWAASGCLCACLSRIRNVRLPAHPRWFKRAGLAIDLACLLICILSGNLLLTIAYAIATLSERFVCKRDLSATN